MPFLSVSRGLSAKSQNQGTFAYNIPATVRLTKEQAQLKNFFRDMSVVTGLNVELFQSQTDANGNYTGENGSFDPSANTLRIDINAGLNHAGQRDVFAYSMLNTAAHELTHVAKLGNKYELLREAVIAALGTTEKDFKTLVEKKFNQLRDNERYDRMTDKELMELADEEVICDSCETMLQGNTGFFEKLYKKDKSLARIFVDAIKNLVEKIKAFVTGRKHANTKYGKALLEVADDLYSQIQQLWNEAVESGLEAAHTQTAENKKAADAGGVRLSTRQEISKMDIPGDSNNNSSIKEQINANIEILSKMSVVKELSFDKNKGDYVQQLNAVLKNWGYNINRQDGISFLFDKEAIGVLRHYVHNDEEAAAAIIAPYVLKLFPVT